MDEHEAQQFIDIVRRHRPQMGVSVYRNPMTQLCEVEINGGDPRGVRVWLKTPRQVMAYLAWLEHQPQVAS